MTMRRTRERRIHPVGAGWLGIAAILLLADGPAVADDSMKLVLGFESRSTRLTAADTGALDRLVATLESQPDNHLVVFAPSPRSDAIRHFVASRLAVVSQELLRRGIIGETVKSPRSDGNDADIVLWIVPRALPSTPLEILPVTDVSLPLAVVPSLPAKNDVPSAPVSLLPGDGGGKDGTPAVRTDAVLVPEGSGTQSIPPKRNGIDTAPASASSDIDVEELWVAVVGQSLRTVLKDWSARAGWTVVWQSDREYPVDAAATFSGDFTKAAGQLFEGFATAIPAPAAHFYKGNHVLLVESGEGR